jgi:hypothetical protein
MRWVRIKTVLLALCMSAYFAVAHSSTNGFLTSFFITLLIIVIFGSAFLDRILYDPSAVFIEKPWRVMRPSIGDLFRLYTCLVASVLTLPIIFLRGSFLGDAALLEVGLITFSISIYEFLRLYVERVRWHGTSLDVRSKFGRRVSLQWSEIRNVRMARFSHYAIFTDRSGRGVKVSKRLRGFSEFMRDAERYCPPEVRVAVRTVK